MALGLMLVAHQRYWGLTLGSINQLRYAGWAETGNLMGAINYWLTFMAELSPHPTTGRYDFHETATGAADLKKGLLAFHRGEPAQAIHWIQRDLHTHGDSEERLFWLAMAYLRQAEAENCTPDTSHGSDDPFHLTHSSGVPCALPLERLHPQAGPSTRAAELFQRLLDEYNPDDPLYRWLLNFSLMTVGDFPARVPEPYGVDSPFTDFFYGEPAKAAAERHQHLSFAERAHDLGIDTLNAGRGVAVEDFDGDGYLDIVTGGSFEDVRFYHNSRGRSFEDRTLESGLSGISQPFVITAADYDNDGWVDLFVARPFDHFLLLRNRGDGTFIDVTEASGLLHGRAPDEIAATWVSAWADVDNDGDLDLFLAQWAFRLPFVTGLMARPRMDSKLFINETGRFLDRTAAFGLAHAVRDQYLLGATFGDMDNDGDPDLYVSSPLPGISRVFENTGNRFVAGEQVKDPAPGFVAAWVDVDHDGRLDLFRGGFADARTSTEQAVFGDPHGRYRVGRSAVLHQDAGGRLWATEAFGDAMPMGTMGSSYGDLDNDGCHDFYLGTGNPESWFVLPNLMYLGQSDGARCTGRWQNISNLHGWGTIQKGHGIVFFDFDNDGDQDVYSSLGGMWPADRWPNQFFVNQSRLSNTWIKIRLRGRQSNHFGIGARIMIEAERPNGEMLIRRYHMDGKTGFGSAPYLAHIGLLDAVSLRRVEVYWPTSQCRQSYRAELETLNVLDESRCAQGSPTGGTAP